MENLSKDKQTEIQQFAIDLQNASQKASKIITDETANYVKEHHNYKNLIDYAKAHIKSRFEYEAEFLTELGYAKASEIFEEIGKILRRYGEIAERDKSEYGELIVMDIVCAIGELRKKYTEDCDG